MSGQGLAFTEGGRAVQLDLIGKVRGLESAESYFNSLNDEDKVDKLYGALLNCYVREGLIDESLSLMQKMKGMGFFGTALNYNGIMCLYTNTGQHEKIPDVLLEMKENGVSPDNFSYRICINSYGTRSDLRSMENVLQEMESQSHISMDWVTYSTVANYYIKAGLKEKAIICLKKCEDIVSKSKDALGYNHLISHYASLGNKDEMMKLWGLQKIKCKKQVNRDYITMLGCLVKIGELEEAEKLFQDWESSCYCYDFRVPNIILLGYSQKGMVEKADAILKDIVKKGKTPTPNSWSIIAAGYADKKNMEKAFECMKEALAVHEENIFWRPKPSLLSSILDWLDDKRDVEEVEAFTSSLKINALRKASIRSGQEVDGLLESSKADDIDETE